MLMMSFSRSSLHRYQCHNHERNNVHALKRLNKTKNTPPLILTQLFHSNPFLKEGVQQAEELIHPRTFAQVISSLTVILSHAQMR